MVFALKLRLLRAHPFEASSLGPDDDLRGLVQAWRRSDRKALRTLLVALGPSMLQVIRRVLGAQHPDVEDVLQEATMALVAALPRFRGQSTARHFACRIATFTAITALRRQRRAGRAVALPEEDAGGEGDAGSGQEPDSAVESRRRDVLRGLLAELPSAQAEALVLHCIVGMTVEELAQTAGTPVETARSRLRLGKAAMRARHAADPVASELLEVQP